MSGQSGFDGKVYYNATPETEIPTTVAGSLWDAVRDASCDSAITMNDVSSRASRRKNFRSGMIDDSFTLQVLDDPTDTTLDAIKAAADDGTEFSLILMSGLATGEATGIGGNVIVENIGRTYPLDDTAVVDITFKVHSHFGRVETTGS